MAGGLPEDYKGALLLVSHDRYFLDRLCTSICEIEQGTLTQYKGNYTTFTQLKEAAVARQWKEYEMQQKEIAKLEDYVARNSDTCLHGEERPEPCEAAGEDGAHSQTAACAETGESAVYL